MNLRWSWDAQTRDLFRWVDPDAWDATVVGSVFRRGAVEVTVDVDLPGRSGGAPARLVALAGAPAVVETGDRVRVVVDPAGCAVVPD